MFQTIVSYVNKAKLGGKSYAPGEDHPFTEFQVGWYVGHILYSKGSASEVNSTKVYI